MLVNQLQGSHYIFSFRGISIRPLVYQQCFERGAAHFYSRGTNI